MFLNLDGLTDPPVSVLSTLARFPGPVSLNGIQTLSVETATALAAHRAALVLDGLLYLPEEVAKPLSKHKGESLSLKGLRFMSDGASKALKTYRGTLELVVDGE